MLMDIEVVLEQFGLNDKEVKVYLSALQLGRAPVLAIAKKAGVKRPTAYLILESLLKQGLVTKVPRKHKTLFIAENPRNLLHLLDKRRKGVEKIMPALLSIFNVSADKPAVKMYEGKEGVNQAYEEIFRSKEIWWFGNLFSVYTNFREVFEKAERMIRANELTLRDFMGNSPFEKKYAATHQRKNHEIRLSNLPIDIDFSIFENKVAILSLEENPYALIIEDKRITNSFKSMYELAWRKAGKFKK